MVCQTGSTAYTFSQGVKLGQKQVTGEKISCPESQENVLKIFLSGKTLEFYQYISLHPPNSLDSCYVNLVQNMFCVSFKKLHCKKKTKV